MNLHHLNLTAAKGKKICGSSSGWLIMIDETSQIISLIKPFNASQIIQLQPIFTNTKTNSFVHKVILSSDPELDPLNFSVLAIFGESRELAYYNSRSQTWSLLHTAGSCYDDIISRNGKFFAVDEYGKICEIGYANLSVKVIFQRWFFGGNKVYLVWINGKLFVIFRYLTDDHPYFRQETYKFQIFELNLKKQEYRMIGKFPEIALFLGQNHSTWLPADDNTTMGVIGNSIYFTDDYHHHFNGIKHRVMDGHDVGLYDMEYNRMVPLQGCCGRDGLHHVFSRPIWFMSDNIISLLATSYVL